MLRVPAGLAARLAEECLLLADYVDWLQETDILANHLLKNLWAIALCDWLLTPIDAALCAPVAATSLSWSASSWPTARTTNSS